MAFLFYTIIFNLLVFTVSANYSFSIENGQSTTKPKTVDKVYNSCGSACPPTCANPEPQVCITICKAGSFCPTGYLENSLGQCVRKEDCDTQSTLNPEPLPTYPPGLQPRPFPFPRPIPRPRPRPIRPFPISFPGPVGQNLTQFSDNFVQYPDLPSFQTIEPVGSQFNLYPSLPQPNFQITPIEYNATDLTNGPSSQPMAVVRTTGSNLPYISRSAIPRVAPIIDLDPTVLRPALRISREQSSEDDKQ